jgi:purine-binding chemotaxis protein CheW
MEEPLQVQPAAEGHQPIDEIEQMVVFTVDQEEYAAPIGDIREVLDTAEITPVPDSPPFVLGMMNLRGKVVPVIDLEKRLNLQRQTDDKSRHILVVDFDKSLIGIRVDVVKEVLKVATKTIQAVPSLITSKISPEFLRGVVVISSNSQASTQPDSEQLETEATSTNSRVLLLLELKKIISTDELQTVSPEAELPPQDLREETEQ